MAMSSRANDSRILRQTIRRILAGAATTGLAVAAPVSMAQTKNVSVSIPSQGASDALRAFAKKAGVQLVYPEDVIDGVTTNEVEGTMSVEEGLNRLLEGTGLEYRVSQQGVVVVTRKSAGVKHLSYSPEATQGTASTDADPLEEVVVSGQVVFTQNDAFGATKMGLALKDTPQTVVVITSDLIDLSGMQTFGDVYKVDASGGTAHAIDGFPRNYYRGFAQLGDNAVRVDGFRMPGTMDLDLATFDRVEVIKGATSTLYGQTSVAGTLNAVSKLPQHRFGVDLKLTGGQFDDYRADADVTGPLGDSGAWSYRLIGAYEDADSFLDFSKNDLRLISGALAFTPSDATTVIARLTHQQKEVGLHFAPALQLAGPSSGDILEDVLADGLKIPDVPRSRFYGMPWNDAHIDANFVQLQLDHTLPSDWVVRAHAQYNRVDYKSNSFAVNGPFDDEGYAYFGYGYGWDNDNSLYGTEINLFGNFQAFGREHTLFFGVDYARITEHKRLGYAPTFGGFESSVFNFYHPDYTAVPELALSEYPGIYDERNETVLYGGTVQLIMHPTDRMSVLLGGRESKSTLLEKERGGDVMSVVDTLPFNTAADLSFHKFTLQSGVTYELTDTMNLYASYGETFEPKSNRVYEGDGLPGKLIDPEIGKAYELGLKAGVTKDLSLTAAVFQMERTNIAQTDPAHPLFSVALGTQRSRGVELGAQGRLTREINLFASLAYLDAEFSEGEFKGLQPPNAPRLGASVYGTYEVLEGGLKGLGFSVGVVHKEGLKTFDDGLTSAAGVPVTFDFGDFTEVDARVFYNRDHWTFSLSGSNLFDEKYYSPSFTSFTRGTHVNPPRMVKASLRYNF